MVGKLKGRQDAYIAWLTADVSVDTLADIAPLAATGYATVNAVSANGWSQSGNGYDVPPDTASWPPGAYKYGGEPEVMVWIR